MNSKFLYAATVAASLLSVSTLTFADEAPLTRAQVSADLHKAIADGSLKRTDHDVEGATFDTRSATTRARVATELAQDRAERRTLVGADASRDYNPLGTAIHATSTLTRAEVRNETLQAAANGTLRRTDHDDAASLARQARQHTAANRLAQRVQAKFAPDAS